MVYARAWISATQEILTYRACIASYQYSYPDGPDGVTVSYIGPIRIIVRACSALFSDGARYN